MNIFTTIKETFADGLGIRYSIYVSGCNHHCKNCHNPQTWDSTKGIPMEKKLNEIISEIKQNPMLTGITISGGDPFINPEDLFYLIYELKYQFKEKNIWIYTGYTIEELKQLNDAGNIFIKKILLLTDVLIDGRYDETKKIDGQFYGSSNQRLIKSPYQFFNK